MSFFTGTSHGRFLNIADNQPEVFWELRDLRPLHGTGLTIAFLDTGINKHHQDFTDKIKVARSFVDPSSTDSDGLDPSSTHSDGHGTTCAGIAAGGEQMWSDVHWSGVAPGVQIVMCKVARVRNSFDNGALIQALQFLLKA